MTSTSYSIGLDEKGRNSSKVLKPPGGGTSDLFTANGDEVDKAASVILPLTQDPGANGNGIDIPSYKHGSSGKDNDEGDEILGTTGNSTSFKDLYNVAPPSPKRFQASAMSRNCVTGDGCQSTDHYVIRVHRQRDGNPVTGEGYDTPKPSSAQERVNGNGPAPTGTQPSRARVPPGGFSSGLW